jgi:hypothetical protein
MSITVAIASSIYILAITPLSVIKDLWAMILLTPWSLVIFAFILFLLSRTNRNRGAFIRIHRGTRKLYYIFPGKQHLHILDWDQLEVLAGYIPIVSGSGYATRHPLYLIGVDYGLPEPGEVCVACGNLGVHDGDRSAKSLWEYLQRFMANGPEGLPEPPLLPSRMPRRQATWRHLHEWKQALLNCLTTTRGKLWAPVMLPLRVFWLFFWILPNCLEEFILYHVPYTAFPEAIDELCGFTEQTNHLH